MGEFFAASHPLDESIIGLHVNLAEVAERLKKYRRIIDAFEKKHGGGKPVDVHYSSHVEGLLLRNEQYLRNKLPGRILLDVGAGSASHVRDLAGNLDVSFLIEIEKYSQNIETGWGDTSLDGLRVIRFHADMLEALARLPSESANVIMNGIDHAIIHHGTYREAVFEEIARIVPYGGIFFGFGGKTDALSNVSNSWELSTKFKPVNLDISPSDGQIFFCFEKEISQHMHYWPGRQK